MSEDGETPKDIENDPQMKDTPTRLREQENRQALDALGKVDQGETVTFEELSAFRGYLGRSFKPLNSGRVSGPDFSYAKDVESVEEEMDLTELDVRAIVKITGAHLLASHWKIQVQGEDVVIYRGDEALRGHTRNIISFEPAEQGGAGDKFKVSRGKIRKGVSVSFPYFPNKPGKNPDSSWAEEVTGLEVGQYPV